MKVKCPNSLCKNEWDYNGKSNWYATCPRCHGNVRIRELYSKGDKLND